MTTGGMSRLLHSAGTAWRHALLILLAASAVSAQQIPPSLQITSPADNSVVEAGGILTLTITSSPTGTAFSQIAIFGPGFIGFNVIAPTSLPTQFSLPIPPDADCRKYTVTVAGIAASGAESTPAQLQIDVERPDAAVGLSASPSSLTFQSQGEQSVFRLVATFFDNSAVDVTESTLVFYSSSNTGVATVDATGTVTAVAPGDTVITATYGQGPTNFAVSIPVTVLRPLLTASPGSLAFAARVVGTTSAPQQVTLTNTSTGLISQISATITGDFSEADNCVASLPLAVGSSCTANITFTPSGVGIRTGTVSVAYSSSDVPLSISLTGAGPTITAFSPTTGPVGTTVTISGTGFSTTISQNTVTFNGTIATITSATATQIVTSVPIDEATSGPISVTTPNGTATSSTPFTVTTDGGALRPTHLIQPWGLQEPQGRLAGSNCDVSTS